MYITLFALYTIQVVLLFTYTSSDIFTLLFYNLISFVLTYDPGYKNDTPESIFKRDLTKIDVWSSTPGGGNATTPQLAYTVLQSGVLYSGHWAHDGQRLQRPVLYLNNI